jgi:hypothetical protein
VPSTDASAVVLTGGGSERSHAARMKTRTPLASRLIFTLLGVLLPVSAHLADYNATHVFNDQWPPHAKFHGGQTLSFAIMLGLLTMVFAWRPAADRVTSVLATVGFCGVYWTSQATAILYPGTAYIDPRFDSPAAHPFGVPVQILVEIGFLGLTAVAAWLALRGTARTDT